jgi:hypothetical protein
METFSFDADAGFTPADERLTEVVLNPLTPPLAAGSPVQAAIFRLGPGGRIARHPAEVPQILAVIAGAGEISGADDVFVPISSGEAVFWGEGEVHETETESGLTAIVLEAPGLGPFRRPE